MVMVNTFITISVIAILLEGIWEILKNIIPKNNYESYVNTIGTIGLGILLAFLVNLDLFALLDIQTTSVVINKILTGIIISRGSNYVHDLICKVKPNNLK